MVNLGEVILPESSVIKEKMKNIEEKQLPWYNPRRSFLQGIYAAIQRPLGYGSHYNPEKYRVILDANIFLGLPEEGEYVPAHSHIVGAMVYSGWLSLAFWLFMIYANIKLILYSYTMPALDRIMMFIIPLSLNNLWAIAFSPFSERVLLAFSAAMYILIFTKSREG